MSEEELAAIEDRHSATDVPALIAEIRRLQKALKEAELEICRRGLRRG